MNRRQWKITCSAAVLLVLHTVTTGATIWTSNPCSNYTVLLGETWRRSSNDSVRFGDDSTLDEGWYRVVSPAGNRPPDSCVQPRACGSFYPVWMNGSLPTAAGNLTAHLSHVNNNCSWCSWDVPVMNCGDFHIYYLTPVPWPNTRYCFGSEAPCPPGTWSYTGYTPDCINNSLITSSTTRGASSTSVISTTRFPLPTDNSTSSSEKLKNGVSGRLFLAVVIPLAVLVVLGLVLITLRKCGALRSCKRFNDAIFAQKQRQRKTSKYQLPDEKHLQIKGCSSTAKENVYQNGGFDESGEGKRKPLPDPAKEQERVVSDYSYAADEQRQGDSDAEGGEMYEDVDNVMGSSRKVSRGESESDYFEPIGEDSSHAGSKKGDGDDELVYENY